MVDKRRANRLCLLLMGGVVCLGFASQATAQELQVVPAAVTIGTFFSGARIMISSDIPQGCGAVLEVIGKKVREELMRKGRRWDVWMNEGELDIDGVPCLYVVMSSDRNLLMGENQDPRWGYEALRKKATFRGRLKGKEMPEFFREFVLLKEDHGLYGTFPGALRITPSAGSRSRVYGEVDLPSRVPTGIYKVCLTVIRDGRPVEQKSVPFEVTMVGLPAFLASLASTHEVLYGLVAVALAVGAGIFSGYLFGGRGHSTPGRDQCDT